MKKIIKLVSAILIMSVSVSIAAQHARVKRINAPYQGELNLKIGFGSRTLLLRDNNGSGTPNFSLKYTYDSRGNKIMEETDLDYDGKIDRVYSWTYDEENRETSYVEDDVNDGTPSYRSSKSYNSRGEVSERRISFDGNKTWDQYITNIFDKDGNYLEIRVNDDLTTKPEKITKYTYEKGLRMRRELFTDGAGIIATQVQTWTYNNSGLVSKKELDLDNDGNIDIKEIYTYDKLGRVLTEVSDTDGNGFSDKKVETVYAGNMETTYTDEDGDLVWDRIIRREYNPDHFKTYEERDNDGNGSVDRKDYVTYNADNKILTWKYDTDGDGTIDQNLKRFYDLNGNMNRAERDLNMDGKPDQIDTYETFNPVYCPDGFKLPTHYIEVQIPSNGFWSFSTENSSQLVNLKLSKKARCMSEIASAQSTTNRLSEIKTNLDTGTYYLTVEPTVNNILAPGEYQLNIRLSAPTNIAKITKEKITLYPNPSLGILNIKGVKKLTLARILGINGKIVKTLDLSSSQTALDITNLKSGIYFLDIDGQYYKFTKQ